MESWPTPFNALAAYRQFILWRLVDKGPNLPPAKVPINPQGIPHDPHDSAAWLSAQEALEIANTNGWGVGFVFTDADPFFFLDIDKCLQTDRQWSPLAITLCQQFAGCAIEVSQSGQGLHIFGTAPTIIHGCTDKANGLELYTSKRFVALTGKGARGDAGTAVDLTQLVTKHFPPTAAAPDATWTDKPVPEWSGPEDNKELLQRMLASISASSIFGESVSIQALWDADGAVLGSKYPDGGGRAFDWSSADAALCAHLAFWTGKNCERMDQLFRRSALYRDKWEVREDYRYRTIGHAIGHCKNVYQGRPSDKPTPASQDAVAAGYEPVQRSGYQFLSSDQQLEYFKGCVYVQTDHRVFTPRGILYKPEQFKAMYGGYNFALDVQNESTTTNAWEVFTMSQAITFPKVNITCFRPDKAPGEIIEEEGWLTVNAYIPIITESKQGDPAPFLDLIKKLFPIDLDKQIILAYISACVQHAGIKFQWAPLIQGCEGNGKSFIVETIAHAVGWRYVHKPPASDISNVFNAWMRNKLFIGVEEVYVKDRREVMDALKPLISDNKIPYTPKGVDQFTGDNRANFLCNTNHKGALIIARRNNRRWCIFYTPQQSEDDLIRDGMSGNYFPRLYDWARKEGGHAIINNYLRTYVIPENLNPATKCHRAPATSSIEEAALISLGGLEQEITEAIAEDRPGFAGGWVSSMAFDRLIKNRRDDKRISINRRREILYDLGYILHPGLPEGRVSCIIPLDNGKPRLYIRASHTYLRLNGSADIVQQYLKDQGVLTQPLT